SRGGVEPHHARSRAQVDPLLAPPLVRAEVRVLARVLALEVLLRARRAVVRRVGLAADEQDVALAAGLAQPARAVRARHATADQQMRDVTIRHRSGLTPDPRRYA